MNQFKQKQRADPRNTPKGVKARALKKRHAKQIRRAVARAKSPRVNAEPLKIPAYTVMEQRAKDAAKKTGTTPMMARLFGWMPGVNRKTDSRLPGYRFRGG